MVERTLQGKVALVTGAGRGIGKAIALAYAQAGAAIGCAARTLREIEATASEIQAANGQALAVPVDVTQREAVEQAFQATVDAFGGLDILVINAGANYDRRTVEASEPDDWEATLAVNLTGAYYCARAAIPYMRDRGGKIITVGSGLGHHGIPTRSAYACAKAGLWMLTRVLAQELWDYHISVNELIPGPVQTAMTHDGEPPLGTGSEWFKTPADVVPLALFLATQPLVGPTAQSFSLMRRDT